MASNPVDYMKYVVVTGGVLSGLGKGVTASSIGVLLKSAGLKVTSIKIDPYLNSDVGTMSPFEHGEVFVLDDEGKWILIWVIMRDFWILHSQETIISQLERCMLM